MEWVAALKHHTREVYPKIEAFYATRPVNRESRLAAARIFDAWVRSLPDSEDADVWEWFDWKGCQYQSGCLYSVVTHFKDMIELDEQGALGKKT